MKIILKSTLIKNNHYNLLIIRMRHELKKKKERKQKQSDKFQRQCAHKWLLGIESKLHTQSNNEKNVLFFFRLLSIYLRFNFFLLATGIKWFRSFFFLLKFKHLRDWRRKTKSNIFCLHSWFKYIHTLIVQTITDDAQEITSYIVVFFFCFIPTPKILLTFLKP